LTRAFRNPNDIRDEVRITVIHEIAHHFGISDERLDELGW
jgi:predicted Zn-dependent protease with MMP-like domain